MKVLININLLFREMKCPHYSIIHINVVFMEKIFVLLVYLNWIKHNFWLLVSIVDSHVTLRYAKVPLEEFYKIYIVFIFIIDFSTLNYEVLDADGSLGLSQNIENDNYFHSSNEACFGGIGDLPLP